MGVRQNFGHFLENHELGLCSLLGGASFIVFMILLPLMIDPSLLSFVMRFEATQCSTTESAKLVGVSNCTWTSCQTGCTVDFYTCWHIFVRYETPTPPVLSASSPYGTNPVARVRTRLFPNVIGCGYPPAVDCQQFYQVYGPVNGRRYPCYVSLNDPTLAVIDLNLDNALKDIALGFAPLALFLFIVVYVCLRMQCRKKALLKAREQELLTQQQKTTFTVPDIVFQNSASLSRKDSWINKFREGRDGRSSSSSSNKSKINDKKGLNIASISASIPNVVYHPEVPLL